MVFFDVDFIVSFDDLVVFVDDAFVEFLRTTLAMITLTGGLSTFSG